MNVIDETLDYIDKLEKLVHAFEANETTETYKALSSHLEQCPVGLFREAYLLASSAALTDWYSCD